MLEPSSLLTPYTDWLLGRALADRAGWTGLDAALPVSVNLAAHSLLDRDLPARVADAVTAAGLRPGQLMLELTESNAVSTMSTVDTVLEDLRRYGVRIAVDDFGSGHTSLARLMRVPATDLKIAPELVSGLLDSVQARAMVRAAAEIAGSSGVRVIAVGTDTLRHALMARDAGQGALFGPVDADLAHAVLRDQAAHAAGAPTARVIPLTPRRPPDDPT